MVERNDKHHKPRRRRQDKSPNHKDLNSGSAGGGNDDDGAGSSSYQPHGALLIQLTEDAPTWHECAAQQADRNATIATDPPPSVIPKGQTNNTPALIAKYRSLADEIYAREVQLFSKKMTGDRGSSSSSDQKWVEATMRKGTLKDRIAAMSVVVTTDPVHKFYALDGLLQMTGCSESGHQETNSRVAQLAAEAIEDLFLNTFLPSQRKLLTLAQRPLYLFEKSSTDQDQTSAAADDDGKSSGSKFKKKKKKKTQRTLSPRILLLWRFEEMVKEKYHMFLRQYVGHTLQEGVELQKIPAVRSAATLLRSVPEGEETLLPMIVNKLGDPGKKVAAAAGHELRRVLQQHPVMQQVVAREVQQLAHRPHLSSRALYNCIIFLNQLRLRREDPDDDDDDDDDTTKRKVATSLPASLISTYFRLFEVTVNKKKQKYESGNPEDGMKSRLLSALLSGVNRAHPYLPKRDQTMEQHIDALYRLVHTAPPAACTQALLLLFHLAIGSRLDDNDNDNAGQGKAATLSEEEAARQNRFYRALYSTLSEAALLNSGKHLTMFFNILYKAMKYDTDANRVGAFAKRIAATTMHESSAVSAASLFLMNEITKTHPTLLTSFQEVLEGNDATLYLDCTKRDPRGALVSSSSARDGSSSSSKEEPRRDGLDSTTTLRRAPGWELSLSLNHFHPSVRKFASSMGEDISYTGDPLKDFALVPFLDKFAYRNPKSAQRVAARYKRGESIAERRSATESMIQSQFALPVNDPSFLHKQDVGPEDEFFHKFFVERAKRDEIKGIVRHAESSKEMEPEEAEVEALDAAEEDVVGDSFDKYESQWDTDSDEEAFVDSLAEKIIEDAAGDAADLSDEDPDMEDWDDMYHDDDDDGPGDDKEEEDSDGSADSIGRGQDRQGEEPDDDAFMDDSGDDEESEAEESIEFGEDMLADERDREGEDSDESGDEAMFLPEDESSVESTDGVVKNRKRSDLDTFAPAEDYEEQVSKSWSELKRSRPPLHEDGAEESSTPRVSKKSTKRKGKRRKMQTK